MTMFEETKAGLTVEHRQRIRAWVKALRSGNYLQGQQVLAAVDDERRTRYCCLGVACEVFRLETGQGRWLPDAQLAQAIAFGVSGYSSAMELPNPVSDWLGLDRPNPVITIEDDRRGQMFVSAALANDERGWDFERIADAIEKTYLS